MKLPVMILALLAALAPPIARAEILAALNYESKPSSTPRREGIAIVDIDPASPRFNTILRDGALPPDFIAHHIYYNSDRSRAYVTSLGRRAIAVYDMAQFPQNPEFVSVPDCAVGEDMAFTRDGKRWFLSCMGSSTVIVGDARDNRVLQLIAAAEAAPGEAPRPYIKNPHGLTLNENLDLLIVTSTADPADFSKAGDSVTFIEASTGRLLATERLSEKPAPAAEAPVESVFAPGRAEPTLYVTNMLGGALWTGVRRAGESRFRFSKAFDFATLGQGMPLEMEFDSAGARLFVTTAKPGALHLFDVRETEKPKLLASIPAAAGAHHFVFSPDGRYAFVQNSLLNLDGLSDGSVSVIDVKDRRPAGVIDVLKKKGLNPNCIILLPQWAGAEE